MLVRNQSFRFIVRLFFDVEDARDPDSVVQWIDVQATCDVVVCNVFVDDDDNDMIFASVGSFLTRIS